MGRLGGFKEYEGVIVKCVSCQKRLRLS